MRRLAVIAIAAFATPVNAQYFTDPSGQRSLHAEPYLPRTYSPPVTDYSGSSLYSREQDAARPGSFYQKPETLGDSRGYRETNPKTCTSLLCD